MSEAFPPLYNFNGIDFNADYFAIPNSSTGGSGITLSYANSHYLTNYAGAISTSLSSRTTFENDVAIGTTIYGANSTLDIYGRIDLNNNTGLTGEIAVGNSSLGGNYGGNLYIKSPSKLVLNAGNALSTAPPNIFINNTGNVGIGTNVTPEKFNVVGDSYFEGNLSVGISAPTSLVQFIRNTAHSGPILVIDNKNPNPPRGIGQCLMNIGYNTFTSGNVAGDYYGIGFGFIENTGLNFPPAEIGILIQSSTGAERGDLVFSTRATTTNVVSTERMRITSAGNVGIGKTNPGNILQVGEGGRLRISNGTTDYTTIGTLDTETSTNTRIIMSGNTRPSNAGCLDYVATSATGVHRFYTTDATTERMRIATNGAVGINTISPATTLDVNGSITGRGAVNLLQGFYIDFNNGTNMGNIAQANSVGNFSGTADAGDLVIRSASGKKLILQQGTGNSALLISANNYVGVNTGSANYPLVVSGSAVNYSITSAYGFVGPTSITANNPASGASPVSTPCAVFVSGNLVCSGNMYITSDERIKKNIQPFEGALSIIDKLNVSTYEYIDYCKFQSKKKQYGLIAQQVMEVIPDVITTHEKEFIPNVYKNADGYDNETKSFILTGSFAIAIGDNLKIMDSKNKEHFKKIVDIQGNVYTIEEPIEDYEEESLIFIYGKEVNDLHTINYEHLFNINLKAVQELSAIVKAQQEQINKLLSLIK